MCFSHNLSVASLSNWGSYVPHCAHFNFGDPHENLRNKLNKTQRLEFMKRKIRFDKFKKSVIGWVNIDISV